jgi:hypothetical protein
VQGLGHVLELAVDFIDDVMTGALGGIPLLFGQLQSLGGAFAQRLAACCTRFSAIGGLLFAGCRAKLTSFSSSAGRGFCEDL